MHTPTLIRPLLTLTVATGVLLSTAGCVAIPGALTGTSQTADAPTTSPGTTSPSPELAAACAQAKTAVDDAAASFSAQFKAGLSQATADLSQQRLPDLHFFTVDSGILDSLQQTISDSEISAALSQVRTELTAFQEIPAPESLLAVPGYLADLSAQFESFQTSVQSFSTLCRTG